MVAAGERIKDFLFLRKQVEWLNDPEVMRYSEQRHKTHTIKTQAEYLGSFQWPNIHKYILSEGALLGSITAHVDPHNGVADVGILIGDKYRWGNGYGLEAWSAFCDYLLSLGLRKIEAGCMAHNRGMTNICFRYGMKEEGRRSDHFMLNNKPSDMILFGKFR